jgi:hypothetical protein
MASTDLVGEYVGLWHEGSNKLLVAAGRVRVVTFDHAGEPVLWLQVDREALSLWPKASMPRLHHVYRWPIMGKAWGPLRIEIFAGGYISDEARRSNA